MNRIHTCEARSWEHLLAIERIEPHEVATLANFYSVDSMARSNTILELPCFSDARRALQPSSGTVDSLLGRWEMDE